ncbi:alpha/beta hydrolase [Azospirillum thermophilum]|uniref:Alpha/beta hydrolase n=1 Tax=Azospirillum thermophilum TaxID=2202148 RepID=A0A2S2CPN9_9PROT|nr:alpha/beta hydrolase [Azospirillum thermophilum]
MLPQQFDWLRLSDGTRLRSACWTGHGTIRGTVLLATGRAEFIEKYAETASALVERGFQVVAFDWRNQGLSDRPLANPQIHHLNDFSTLADDLDQVHAQAVVPRAGDRPVLLMAHSMGGMAATLLLARRPDRYAAAVLSAPMYDIATAPLPRSAVRVLARLFCRMGRGERYAFGQHDYDPAEGEFRPDNSITSDPGRYAAFHTPFRERPELRVGGVSFGWVRAALRASDLVQNTLPLAQVKTPVLLLSAPGDRVVKAAAHWAVARRMPAMTVLDYPDAKHELLMERDAIRDRVWADIDAFLARTVPAPVPAAAR